MNETIGITAADFTGEKFGPFDSTEATKELLATAMAPILETPAYEPTRLEYFSVQILQGLIIGRQEQPKVVGRAISIAKELALALDVEQNL